MLKLFLTAILVALTSQALAKKVFSEDEVAHLAENFIRIYESNAQISSDAVHQLSASIGEAYSYVILKKPKWRGSSQSLLICTTIILSSGLCKDLTNKPSPWMGPQEYIEMVWPDKNPVVKSISFYASNASLYIFYSFVEPRAKHIPGDLQDPSLSTADIPWNNISHKRIDDGSTDLIKTPSESPEKSPITPVDKPIGIVKIPYKDLYIRGKEMQLYDSSYFTIRLGSFNSFTEARSFKKSFDLTNAFTITTMRNDKRTHHVYFGVFPTESDVHKALEILPRILISQKPTLHSLGQAQLEQHNYESWKKSRIQELKRSINNTQVEKSND